MGKRSHTIFRWAAVLPVALLSIIVAGLTFDALLWSLAKLVPDNYFTFMPQGMISTIKAFLVTSAGMYGGVKMAPKEKFATGVVLVAINTLSYLFVFSYVYMTVGFGPIGFTTHFWPAMQAIAGLSAAPFVCAQYYADEKHSRTPI